MKNNITSNKKYLIMGWLADFKCPGGDCGLTCCSEEWGIKLTDDEIDMYRNLNHEYKDTILENIDYEKKTLKCSKGKCNLMDEDGYCSIVVNCGEEYLSGTCSIFPRKNKAFGDITEMWVELVCPVVAGYLLDNKCMDFFMTEDEDCVSYTMEEVMLYDTLCQARTKLVSIIQLTPGKFLAGKLYIAIDTCYKIREMIAENQLSREAVIAQISKYDNQDVLAGILSQCEPISDNYKASSVTIFNTLRDLYWYDQLLEKIDFQISKNGHDISDQLSIWLNNREELERDLIAYTNMIREKYPIIIENYMIYSLFTSWCSDAKTFGLEFYIRIIENMLIHIYGMAYWKKQGVLEKKNFTVIISLVDRALLHSEEISESIKQYIKGKPDEVLNMTLMLIY